MHSPSDGFNIMKKFEEGSIFVTFLITYSQSQSWFIAKDGSTDLILQYYEPCSHSPARTR